MENQMNRTNFIKFWSIAVGLMDAVTGLLLILAPELVLRMLSIKPPSPDALVFLSWIGVFVMGVGLSYAMALGKRARGEAVWAFTAMIRILVALFLLVRITDGSLSAAWGVVAVSDALVGMLQVAIIRLDWWKGMPK
jgi:Na+-driven multidrug efflux pump